MGSTCIRCASNTVHHAPAKRCARKRWTTVNRSVVLYLRGKPYTCWSDLFTSKIDVTASRNRTQLSGTRSTNDMTINAMLKKASPRTAPALCRRWSKAAQRCQPWRSSRAAPRFAVVRAAARSRQTHKSIAAGSWFVLFVLRNSFFIKFQCNLIILILFCKNPIIVITIKLSISSLCHIVTRIVVVFVVVANHAPICTPAASKPKCRVPRRSALVVKKDEHGALGAPEDPEDNLLRFVKQSGGGEGYVPPVMPPFRTVNGSAVDLSMFWVCAD